MNWYVKAFSRFYGSGSKKPCISKARIKDLSTIEDWRRQIGIHERKRCLFYPMFFLEIEIKIALNALIINSKKYK